MSRILIFGATSAIAQALARRYAGRGAYLVLIGRHAPRLQAVAADLVVRGAAGVATLEADLTDQQGLPRLLDEAWEALGGTVDVALIAHGTLPDQQACQGSLELTRAAFEANGLSAILLCTALAERLDVQGHGTLAVITSVAGDRGRASNYTYGAAKAAVGVFLQGLRQRLHGRGVQVLTVKPGFVDTPMTAAFAKGPLWSTPDTIARGIERAIARRRHVVYLPWFWVGIMIVIRAIPEAIFKRLRL